MHEYLFRPEVARVALVIGVIVSIVFYERVQLTTGGAIVPAYLAMFLPAPIFIVVTLVISYSTYLVVNRVVAKRVILYGRRKFEVEMLVALGLVTIGTLTAVAFSPNHPLAYGLTGIGFLVPGVIAHDLFRQSPRKTFLAVASTTAIVALIVFLFSSLLEISPAREGFDIPPFDTNTGYPVRLLLGGVIVSVLLGMLVFAKLGLRGGGFITGAYLALVLPRPLDLVFAATCALATWLIVTKFIMPRLLIFGRRKLSTMVLVGAIVSWSVELTIRSLTGDSYIPWSGFTLMTLMVPALLANDAQRQGLEKTLWGASITAIGTFGVMNIVTAGLVAVGLL